MTKLSLAILIVATISSNAFSQNKEWPILKHYDEAHISKIALPIGGIGTGTVSLSGRGSLVDWEIMNRPGKGFSTVTTGNDAPLFSIYINDGEQSFTKGLIGPLQDFEYQHMEGRSVDHHGIPRFQKATFDAAYPFGTVNLSDNNLPVDVRIKAFNPLIPGDADASGIPIAILSYEVTNKSDKPLTVSVCGSIRNFIGKDGSQFHNDWKGDKLYDGAINNTNEYFENTQVKGIRFLPGEIADDDPAWGTLALTTTAANLTTYRTSSIPNAWGNGVLDFWDDFSDDGRLIEKAEKFDHDPMASLAVEQQIPANSTKVFTFYLTWHFPNRKAWSSTVVGNYYTTQYKDAVDVIQKTYPKLASLEDQTLKFVNTFIESDLPEVVKESALFNLSTLRSQTVFRIPSGHMLGWEGCMDVNGSCAGSCTHVWNYEQATAFLFGDLAKTMRDVEFNFATRNNGSMSFRSGLPLVNAQWTGVAADGQMGTIMKMYRDWQLSGDTEFLTKSWPNVKLALAFAWEENSWDADADGVMEGSQHNTMDVNYSGPNPQMQFWYLGALKAAEKMALAMDDNKFAKKCAAIYETGSKWTDENLFNGEYYEHQVLDPETKEIITDYSAPNMPNYQLAKGCLVDQLVGQYMAHICGLGYLAPKDHIKTTLKSISKYNGRESMEGHFNNMRSYALGKESALLMASWPNGRPKIPFPYFTEVMTGFEYAAAVGMMYEGMEHEGLTAVQNIRDRYDGTKRSPFDEAECGHHYARAMASWASVLALTNFQYSAIDQTISFKNQEGNWFWSNGYAWGTCVIKDSQVTINVEHGSLKVKEIRLDNQPIKKLKKAITVQAGQSIQGDYEKKEKILIAGFNWDKIIIIDKESQKFEWVHNLDNSSKQVNDVQLTKSGNILFGYQKGARLITKNHETIWDFKVKQGEEIQTALQLESGDFLLGICAHPSRLVTLSSKGEIKSEQTFETGIDKIHVQFRQIFPTKNDTYLVPLMNKGEVIEMNKKSEVLKRITVGGTPFSAKVLKNGNWIVACGDGHNLVIVDPVSEKIIKTVDNIPGQNLLFVAETDILENGNIMLSNWNGHSQDKSQAKLMEINSKNKIVWRLAHSDEISNISTYQILK